MQKIRILTSFFLVCALLAACSYTEKIKDGNMAFERMQFSVAAQMLTKEHNAAKSTIQKGKIAFKIAESYRRMNQHDKAAEWYAKAQSEQYGVEALKQYAFSLKRAERYDEAAEAFKNLGIEIGSPYEYRKEVLACNQVKTWAQASKQSEYSIALQDFNSSDADYAPCFFKENLVFSSDRKGSMGEEKYTWTGKQFSDLFQVNLSDNKIISFEKPVNSPFNEGAATFNKDYTEIIFTRCGSDALGDNYCQLFASKWSNDTWSQPELLTFVEPNINYAQPALSHDGNTLYFASNHPESWGGYDIFVTTRNISGWTQPKPLGKSINTDGDEMFPTLHRDTLYFSSTGHTNMGGLDIFKTYKLPNDTWSPAYNLKAPINSGGDDFSFIIDEKTKSKEILQQGYFSSSRQNGIGNDDIYSFQRKHVIVPKPVEVVKKDTSKIVTTPKLVPQKLLLDVYVLEKIYTIANNPNSAVLGRKPLAGSSVKVSYKGKIFDFSTNEEGVFQMELEDNTDYQFFAQKANYLSNDGLFSSKGIARANNQPDEVFTLEIVLDKIFKNQEIVLENIYYDFDKWDIRPDARPALDNLASVLLKNPQISIQLSSHTDCRGRDLYNETLSQKRAQAAVDYLASVGVESKRLQAKGYGETLPATPCVCTQCSENEHQTNRRTTFKVLD